MPANEIFARIFCKIEKKGIHGSLMIMFISSCVDNSVEGGI